jgi:hypothetical protein
VRGVPAPRRCRPQGSCPSRRFWLRPRNVRTPRGARRPPCRPDASRPCSMPLASLESPFRAFAHPGSRTRSRGPLLPCGFAFGHGRRDVRERFTTAFPAAPTLCLGLPVKARRTTGP